MRWTAELEAPVDGVVRLMLYEAEDTVWLFRYDRAEDAPCAHAERFDDVDGARAAATQRYGVARERWRLFDDPATLELPAP